MFQESPGNRLYSLRCTRSDSYADAEARLTPAGLSAILLMCLQPETLPLLTATYMHVCCGHQQNTAVLVCAYFCTTCLICRYPFQCASIYPTSTLACHCACHYIYKQIHAHWHVKGDGDIWCLSSGFTQRWHRYDFDASLVIPLPLLSKPTRKTLSH